MNQATMYKEELIQIGILFLVSRITQSNLDNDMIHLFSIIGMKLIGPFIIEIIYWILIFICKIANKIYNSLKLSVVFTNRLTKKIINGIRLVLYYGYVLVTALIKDVFIIIKLIIIKTPIIIRNIPKFIKGIPYAIGLTIINIIKLEMCRKDISLFVVMLECRLYNTIKSLLFLTCDNPDWNYLLTNELFTYIRRNNYDQQIMNILYVRIGNSFSFYDGFYVACISGNVKMVQYYCNYHNWHINIHSGFIKACRENKEEVVNWIYNYYRANLNLYDTIRIMLKEGNLKYCKFLFQTNEVWFVNNIQEFYSIAYKFDNIKIIKWLHLVMNIPQNALLYSINTWTSPHISLETLRFVHDKIDDTNNINYNVILMKLCGGIKETTLPSIKWIVNKRKLDVYGITRFNNEIIGELIISVLIKQRYIFKYNVEQLGKKRITSFNKFIKSDNTIEIPFSQFFTHKCVNVFSDYKTDVMHYSLEHHFFNRYNKRIEYVKHVLIPITQKLKKNPLFDFHILENELIDYLIY